MLRSFSKIIPHLKQVSAVGHVSKSRNSALLASPHCFSIEPPRRGIWRKLSREETVPYDSRIEVTTTESANPITWDLPDLKNPDVQESDVLYKTIEIETLSHDDAVLDSYQKFLLSTTEHMQVEVADVFKPKYVAGVNIDKIFWRRTLLRSAFVHKKKRVQYETRTYFRRVKVKNLTGSTADTFLEYIQRNLPEGVAMKVTRCQSLALPEHLKKYTRS
uniref:Small ribosomal subunit protein uS10m n=1 Tax=Romanomermis culicivorax TaxID=13658 RepID=A0A915LES2_ROMCU